jgi:hypothetical protein
VNDSDAVLVWVGIGLAWHLEAEEGMTLCVLRPEPGAPRTDKAPDGPYCGECLAVRRRLEEVEG